MLTPHPAIVDHYGKPEIIFCGPDEGTADFMAFAAEHARTRGYPFWKAFTTGKPRSLGGLPHDLFGMTTRGVRAYVMGIQVRLPVGSSVSCVMAVACAAMTVSADPSMRLSH